MIDKLEKKILTISKIMGEPIIVRIGVQKNKVQILNADKYFDEEEDETIPTKLNTKIKINKPFTYIG